MSTVVKRKKHSKDTESLSGYLESWVDEYGDSLYRFALARVGDEHVAEDLLQETFLGALRTYNEFQHEAKIQTWLISILQRKIVDHYRRKLRTQKLVAQQAPDQKDGQQPRLTRRQKWDTRPEKTIENREFLAALQSCLHKLPDNLRLAFQLRELDECDPNEICEMLAISNKNLAVRVYRARKALRDCLNTNWFCKD